MAPRPHRAASALTPLVLLAALLLAACGGAAARAPVGQIVGDAAQAARADGAGGAQAADETIRGASTDLPLRRWPAEAPRAVLLALHGYGDHAGSTYGGPAPYWAGRGIEVFAYDQRGFGRNPSNRDWQGDDALVEDLEAVAAEIRRRRPDLPLFVAGHSMGGGVALAAAGEGRLPEIDGMILLAPAVWGGEELSVLLRASAWAAATLAPDTRWENGAVVTIRPSDNIEMLRALSRDPLRFSNPSGREFWGLIQVTDRAMAAAPGAAVPTLVVMGAHDEVIPEHAVRAMFAALPGPKEFAYVDSGWHMLLRDLHAKKVWRLTADWILKRAAARRAQKEAAR